VSGYDIGPSGLEFTDPVTVIIPYAVSSQDSQVIPYWYNNLTDSLSQQGITNIERIIISPTLHALSFTTTHFTQFYILDGGAGSSTGAEGSGNGLGCSMSPENNIHPAEFFIPYGILGVIISILKYADKKHLRIRT
jgi:hypothetical protein